MPSFATKYNYTRASENNLQNYNTRQVNIVMFYPFVLFFCKRVHFSRGFKYHNSCYVLNDLRVWNDDGFEKNARKTTISYINRYSIQWMEIPY